MGRCVWSVTLRPQLVRPLDAMRNIGDPYANVRPVQLEMNPLGVGENRSIFDFSETLAKPFQFFIGKPAEIPNAKQSGSGFLVLVNYRMERITAAVAQYDFDGQGGNDPLDIEHPFQQDIDSLGDEQGVPRMIAIAHDPHCVPESLGKVNAVEELKT